jgi:hypothetical protein
LHFNSPKFFEIYNKYFTNTNIIEIIDSTINFSLRDDIANQFNLSKLFNEGEYYEGGNIYVYDNLGNEVLQETNKLYKK